MSKVNQYIFAVTSRWSRRTRKKKQGHPNGHKFRFGQDLSKLEKYSMVSGLSMNFFFGFMMPKWTEHWFRRSPRLCIPMHAIHKHIHSSPAAVSALRRWYLYWLCPLEGAYTKCVALHSFILGTCEKRWRKDPLHTSQAVVYLASWWPSSWAHGDDISNKLVLGALQHAGRFVSSREVAYTVQLELCSNKHPTLQPPIPKPETNDPSNGQQSGAWGVERTTDQGQLLRAAAPTLLILSYGGLLLHAAGPCTAYLPNCPTVQQKLKGHSTYSLPCLVDWDLALLAKTTSELYITKDCASMMMTILPDHKSLSICNKDRDESAPCSWRKRARKDRDSEDSLKAEQTHKAATGSGETKWWCPPYFLALCTASSQLHQTEKVLPAHRQVVHLLKIQIAVSVVYKVKLIFWSAFELMHYWCGNFSMAT